MKGIRQILADFDVELGERADDFEKSVVENYATRAELEEKLKRIETLSGQVETLSEQIKGFESTSDELASLKAKVNEYESAEAERIKSAQENAARARFENDFEKLLEGRSFVNQLTRDAVFERAYRMSSENPAMDVKTILEAVTKDENVWTNPQLAKPKPTIPTTDNSQAVTEEFVRKLLRRS